jgi:hypothetical protein
MSALLTRNGRPVVEPGATVTYNLRASAFTAASMIVSLRSSWQWSDVPSELPATSYNDICIRTSLLRSFTYSTEEGSPCI